MKNMIRYLPASALALSILMAIGCGNVTVGGLYGDATVVVSGDADTLSLTTALAPPTSTSLLAVGPATADGDVEGEVEVEFLAILVTASGATVELGRDPARVKVDLRGRNELDAVDRQIIPATLYTELRLVFTDIDAEVQGLVIDGTPVPEVRVELEDVSLLVSRPVDLDVGPGDSVELVVDLNTPAWLSAVDPLTGTVNQAVFQELLDVVVR